MLRQEVLLGFVPACHTVLGARLHLEIAQSAVRDGVAIVLAFIRKARAELTVVLVVPLCCFARSCCPSTVHFSASFAHKRLLFRSVGIHRTNRW
jgi:hypothetical protein